MDPEIVKQMMQNGQLGSTPSQTQMPSTAAFSPNQAYVEMPYKAVTVQQPFTLDFSQFQTQEQAEKIYNDKVAQRIKDTLPGQSWSITEKLQYMDPVELKLYEDQMREYELRKINSDMDYNDKAYNVNAMNQTTYNRVKDYGGLVDGLYPTVYFSASPENNYGEMPKLPKLEELSKSDQFSKSREGASGPGEPRREGELFAITYNQNGERVQYNVFENNAFVNTGVGVDNKNTSLQSVNNATIKNTMTVPTYDFVVGGNRSAPHTMEMGVDGAGVVAESDKIFWGILKRYSDVKAETGSDDAAKQEVWNAGKRYAEALGYSNDAAETYATHFATLMNEAGKKLGTSKVTESNMKFKIVNPTSVSRNENSPIGFEPTAFASLVENMKKASSYLIRTLLDYKPNVASYTPRDEFLGNVRRAADLINGRNRLYDLYFKNLNSAADKSPYINLRVGPEGDRREVTDKDIITIMSNN